MPILDLSHHVASAKAAAVAAKGHALHSHVTMPHIPVGHSVGHTTGYSFGHPVDGTTLQAHSLSAAPPTFDSVGGSGMHIDTGSHFTPDVHIGGSEHGMGGSMGGQYQVNDNVSVGGWVSGGYAGGHGGITGGGASVTIQW